MKSLCAAAMLLLSLPVIIQAAPALAPASEQADAIRVAKGARKMELLRGGRVLRTYHVALGGEPMGHKRQQGDQRTPECDYTITYRNAQSRFHLSLRVSYPNAVDRAQAAKRGVDPGGDIMIHGGTLHGSTPPGYAGDWTDGCVAVTNAEIEEIWRLVPVGTPIHIGP
ncbi:MAG: L,D-transpeptidase family protein [Pseudoxanthomonas sp.]